MSTRIRMTTRFVRSGPQSFNREAAARALARALCPEVFALNDECQAAMAEANRLLGNTGVNRERERRRQKRMIELRAELASLEGAA